MKDLQNLCNMSFCLKKLAAFHFEMLPVFYIISDIKVKNDSKQK